MRRKSENTGRTGKSLRNVAVDTAGQVISLIVRFIGRKVFVLFLAEEYLGLNGLFSNILTVLSLAELGVGTAIVYSLYRPLSEGNIEKVKSLMRLFKRAYTCIGLFVLCVGAALTPFLSFFVKEMPRLPHIRLIYLMYVGDSAASYFFSYKRSLLMADQNRYIISLYQYTIYTLKAALQILLLWLYRDFIIYLAAHMLSTLLENLLVSRRADKMYPYLRDRDVKPLPEEVSGTIRKNVAAMLCHRLGGVVVNGTDNLLIAKLVAVSSVGLYSNYLMITTALTTAYDAALQSLTAGFGNLNVSSDDAHKKEVFDRLSFGCSWLYGWSAICLVCLSQSFIRWWLGEALLLDMSTVCWIAAVFYVGGMRKATLLARDAMGLYWNDRFKPLAEALINLVVSIILGRRCGIDGILMGTVISTMTTCFWVEPLMLYRHGLHAPVGEYFLRYGLHTLITLGALLLTQYGISLLPLGDGLPALLLRFVLCATLPNLFYLLCYRRKSELRYYKELAGRLLGKVLK